MSCYIQKNRNKPIECLTIKHIIDYQDFRTKKTSGYTLDIEMAVPSSISNRSLNSLATCYDKKMKLTVEDENTKTVLNNVKINKIEICVKETEVVLILELFSSYTNIEVKRLW